MASIGVEFVSPHIQGTNDHPVRIDGSGNFTIHLGKRLVHLAMASHPKQGTFEVNRGLPAPMLIKYFDQVGRDWQAKPELRDMVEAKECNLLERWPMVPQSDIVFLRNVLIYLSAETKTTILERIRTEVLHPDGYLFLGSSETTLNLPTHLKAMRFDRGQCYRP